MHKFKKNVTLPKWVVLLFALFLLTPYSLNAQGNKQIKRELKNKLTKGSFRFIVLNDAGKNGYADQKKIAQVMGDVADVAGVDYILSAGDQLHFRGVKHVDDPFWITNFETIYTHPKLMSAKWYAVPGNHEYLGSVDAFVNYSKKSPRWKTKSRYFYFDFNGKGQASIRIIMLDTTPLMERYHKKRFDDAAVQDVKAQLAWCDSLLSSSKAACNVVIGHHPIYANTDKRDDEQEQLREVLNPILMKHAVDTYICGHIHNFQFINVPNSTIDYIVNTSASEGRPVHSNENLVYGTPQSGFLLGEVTSDKLNLYLINKEGRIIYSYIKNIVK